MDIKFYGGPQHGKVRKFGNFPDKKLRVLFSDPFKVQDLSEPVSPIGPKVKIAEYDLMVIGGTVSSKGFEYKCVYVFF